MSLLTGGCMRVISGKSSSTHWFLFILAFGATVFVAATATGDDLYSITKEAAFQPGAAAEEGLPYGLSPPHYISLEFADLLMEVDLNGNGPLALSGTIPVAGSQLLDGIVVNICPRFNIWRLNGSNFMLANYMYEKASTNEAYRFRPDPSISSNEWKNFVLELRGLRELSIIRASDSLNFNSSRIPIVPNPSITGGNPVLITFPEVNLEWSRDTNQARARAGNVVLSSVDFSWDQNYPNVCYLGNFRIDLKSGQVIFRDYKRSVRTSLAVTIDESPGQRMVSLEPGLWW